MIKMILTDIEGTTSKISFVHEILFPFARAQLSEFITYNLDSPDVTEQLNAVKTILNQTDVSIDLIIETLIHWIDTDQKVTPLKALQGMIWRSGYDSGAFTGHVYRDAYDKMKEWHDKNINLYIYSSGSIEAQKLLFQHSDFGDLTPLLSGYFDTTIGKKQEYTSYENICQQVPFQSNEILFLSDVMEELDAAQTAGMNTYQLIRDNQSAGSHRTAATFYDIIVNL